FFFFSSRRRHTRSKRDWSSDVCSSDLVPDDISKDKVGVIAPETVRQYVDKSMQFVSLCRDEESYREAAKNLYAALRHMDASDVEVIYIYGFKQSSETEALMNRIYKATGNTIIKG